MIARETIDQIFQVARVEEILGEFLQLKKSGSNFKALSPFTDEKTPSLMISPSKQIWKDFSSGKGGNVVSFLMEHEQYTYPEALIFLAKRYNIEIKETKRSEESKDKAQLSESLFIASEFARNYFKKTLLESEEGKSVGLTYFKERGYDLKTIEKFDLGYCLNKWDGFTKEALDQGYEIKYLYKTGLTIVKENGKPFDRFKGRVIFPIHSFSGRILGFAGRILIKKDNKSAKYINSPESEIYQKSKILYGVYHAKKSILKQDLCYLVEGYTDVITLFQSGIENVVASSGTSLTEDQIRIIKRLTPNVTILYDGDPAGIKAAFRGIDLILKEGMNIKLLAFPKGEDPDSFARKTPQVKLKEYLTENQTDFIQFKTSFLLEETKNDLIKKSEAIKEVIQTIALIPDLIKRELYIRQCSSIMKESEKLLFSQLAMVDRKAVLDDRRKEQKTKKLTVVQQTIEGVSPLYILERALIRNALLYGDRNIEMPKSENAQSNETLTINVLEAISTSLKLDGLEFQTNIYREIFQEMLKVKGKQNILIETYFSTHPDIQVANLTSNLMFSPYKLSDWESKSIFVITPEDRILENVRQVLNLYKRERLEKMIVEIDDKIEQSNNEEPKEIKPLLVKYMKLKKLKSIIDKERGRVIY